MFPSALWFGTFVDIIDKEKKRNGLYSGLPVAYPGFACNLPERR